MKSKARKIYDVLGTVLFAAIFVYFFLRYPSVPEMVPTHYNFSGECDDMGAKSSLIWIGVIEVFIYISLGILSRYPHKYNYPFELTDKNKTVIYEASSAFVLALRFIVMLILALPILAALEGFMALPMVLVPAIIILPALIVFFYLYRLYQLKREYR